MERAASLLSGSLRQAGRQPLNHLRNAADDLLGEGRRALCEKVEKNTVQSGITTHHPARRRTRPDARDDALHGHARLHLRRTQTSPGSPFRPQREEMICWDGNALQAQNRLVLR